MEESITERSQEGNLQGALRKGSAVRSVQAGEEAVHGQERTTGRLEARVPVFTQGWGPGLGPLAEMETLNSYTLCRRQRGLASGWEVLAIN